MNILRKIKQFLWPEICPFCGKVHRAGICLGCQKLLNDLKIQEPRCLKCGKPIRYHEKEYCHDCQNTQHYFEQGKSLWLHKSPVNQSIYQFKYHNQREFSKYYAKALADAYASDVKRWKPDVLIPIPLHARRRRKRGYNQAELLAKELSKYLKIPVDSKTVRRVRYTNPQKKMDHSKRKSNLKRAFSVKPFPARVKTVLLIDDIYTTGNTIDAVAMELKKKGVEKVYFLTISIGQGY